MWKPAGLAALLLATLAGCASTWDVDKFEAPGSNVAARRTFAWGGGELGSASAIDPSVVQSADQHMRDTIITALVQKGYQQVQDGNTAGMIVSYQVVGSRKYVTSQQPRFNAPSPNSVLSASAPPPPAASELPRERRVTEGSVIIFVDDPQSQSLIWRGAITAETRSANSEQAIHTAAEMATDILRDFPKYSP